MKKLILSVCALVLMSVFHISCNKDDFQPNKKEGTVEFGFSLKAPSNSGAQKSSMNAPAAEPAAVVVSIKKANGNSAYTMQRVELYNMNGYYISKPLSLLPGSYTVEQFFVVDAAGSVMYASPVQGSPKAYLVSKPLPISFTVGKDVVTKVVPEVLSTANSTPEDFGYTTFSFDVVNTFDFLIGVFVYNESVQNFELTTANLTVAAASKTIYTDTLAAITNKVTLNDGYASYLLTVTKDGYKTWTDTLTAAELKLYFRSEDKGPLEVILEKGDVIGKTISLVTDQSQPSKVNVWIGGKAIVSINWGDGSFSNIAVNSTLNLEHTYSLSGVYNITIFGDVDKIVNFGSIFSKITDVDISNAIILDQLILHDNKLTSINTTGNTKMTQFYCYNNQIESIDFTANKELKQIDLNNNNIQSIDLSNNLKLRGLQITNNKIISIDLSKHTELTSIEIGSNQLRNLNTNSNSKLVRLSCQENLLDSICITNNVLLNGLECQNNKLRDINLVNNLNLTSISCSNNFINTPNIDKLFVDLLANVSANPRSGNFLVLNNFPPSSIGIAAKDSLVQFGWHVFYDN